MRAALLLAPMLLIAGVLRAQTGPAGIAAVAEGVPVIITRFPEDRAAAYALLRRTSGMDAGKSLDMTGAEVWRIPRTEITTVLNSLGALGCVVIDLSDAAKGISMDLKSVSLLNESQRKSLMRLRLSKGRASSSIVAMPHPAVMEYAFMAGQTPGAERPASSADVGALHRVRVPIADGGSPVTLVRAKPTIKTEGAFTWFGQVEETGERAILMLWPDGEITGYVGFKGKIYAIEHIDDRIHAVAEVDPVTLPPDHASLEAGPGRSTASLPPLPPEPQVTPIPDAERLRLESKPIVVDLMMLYTTSAASRYAAGARLLAPSIQRMSPFDLRMP
jgi:hypothetical protein